MTQIDDILNAEKNGKTIFGTNQTIKQLKNGALSEIYLSSNFPEDTKKLVETLAKEAKVKIHILKNSNEELGTLCKKPFKVAAIGILGKE